MGMGIMDRDYYAEGRKASWDRGWGGWGVVIGIIVVTSVAFLLQHVGGAGRNPLLAWGYFEARRVLSGEVWRLVTPLVLHYSIWHVFANMLVVYWAGSRLSAIHGQVEYGVYYALTGVLGYAGATGLTALGVLPAGVGIGANPAVAASLVLFACHFPRQQVLLLFLLPVPVWSIALLYVVVDLLIMLGGGWQTTAVVDLVGAGFGMLYYRYSWHVTGRWWVPRRYPASSQSVRPALRVTTPRDSDSLLLESGTTEESAVAAGGPSTPVDFEAEVDRVLAKVSQYGQASLTAEERAILFQASELYKKRRR
jgi:membrane associated rhomboid family serine protease